MASNDVNTRFTQIPSNPKFDDLTGKVFGCLTVLGFAGIVKKTSTWICSCACGNIHRVSRGPLISGGSKSCGCYMREKARLDSFVHGMSKTPEYVAYHSAKRRCEDPKNNRFHLYGGRGIEFRFASFEEFFAEIGSRPTPKHSVDRKDDDGHYEPGNIRWATATEQSRNRSSNRILSIGGVSDCLAAWSNRYGIQTTTILHRLGIGWCEECAVTLPLRSICPHI